jgi:ataxia telangiectasia mutated family protein
MGRFWSLNQARLYGQLFSVEGLKRIPHFSMKHLNGFCNGFFLDGIPVGSRTQYTISSFAHDYLGLFPERSFAEHNSLHCNSRDILRLIAACLDRRQPPPSGQSFAVLRSLGVAWLHAQSCRKLSDYLLLSPEHLPFQSGLEGNFFSSEVNTPQPTSHVFALESRVFEFFISELEKTRLKWKEMTAESPQTITRDMLRIVANLGFSASALCYAGSPSQMRRIKKLETVLEDLFRGFGNLFSRRIDDEQKLDTVLDCFAQAAPDVGLLASLDPTHFRESGVSAFSMHMSKALETQRLSMESFYAEDIDFMDFDIGPDSQMTDEISARDRRVSRHDLDASTSRESLRSSSSAYLKLIACIVGSPVDEEAYHIVPSGFIDYLTSISSADLLHCRQFVTALISGPGQLQKGDCQALFDHVGAEVMRQVEYQSSEVAEGMVVELLIGTEPLWTDGGSNDPRTQDLHATGQDFYEWFLGGYEAHGWAMSANLQIGVSNLCLCLLRSQPDFAQNLSLPSVRASLFRLLNDSYVPVQYHIAERLPDMFNSFLLTMHDTIFADIHESLPNQEAVEEDMAIRLLALSRLGSSWHTLLRRCVYLIFETAGLVDCAIAHATRCISEVSKSVKVENPPALFKIFAPQIIYSWLSGGHKFADIPFLAFGYSTLLDLIEDIEDEAFGQAMMVGKEDELEYLARLSKQPLQDGLEKNFAKSAAYSISWDTCYGNGKNKAIQSNDARLQAILGNERYFSLFHWHFPRILGTIIYTMDDEDLLDKRLVKRPAFINATNTLKEIKTTSHSSQTLPEGSAPAFTAKFLTDQLERLCRRLRKDPITFWTAETYVFVLRMLLDRIHPALGSLHACSIIRKIRVLVGLAGSIALDGYPLQMALQSLRPFLTDSQCAEDTLGIVQYLFEHGKSFLSSQLSFVTGIGLSILISIRVFLGSTQESTTQESQYHATMDKAKSFHSWFMVYLESYSASVQGSKSHLKAFSSIVRAASQTRIEGNASIGTAESRLLLELLEDERSGRALLSAPSREIAFNLLCQNFQPPKSMRDDVLGSDDRAVRLAPQIWRSCQRACVGDRYLTWAARVLGRAFSAHGELERHLKAASAQRSGPYTLSKFKVNSSRLSILHSLSELLLSDDRKEMGLAESTIRLTLTSTQTAEEQAELDHILPEYITAALTLPLPEGRSNRRSDPISAIKSMAKSTPRKPVSIWIRDLAVNLCDIASQDALLGSLSCILQDIEGYAEKLFPFILHLVLHQEFDGQRDVHDAISRACSCWFIDCSPDTAPYVKILIRTILYLRTQAVPHELTREDRDRWLDVDYLKVSEAATACGMYKSALLFSETHSALPVRSSRGSSTMPQSRLPTALQFAIYKNLDEPDSFYGVEREPSLPTILDRLDYEANGIKSLLFRGALMDSQMRQTNSVNPVDSRGMIKSFIILNLNSVTHNLLSNEQFHNTGSEVVNSTLHTARKLEQWDIRAPQANHSEASTIFKAFQGIHHSSDSASARWVLERQLLATMGNIVGHEKSSNSIKAALRTLAVLTEVDDVVTASDPDQLADAWNQMQSRLTWMQTGQ